jgi:methionyl-tRNA synthetase
MDAVRTRYDAELANEYGNLASRTVAMLQRYRDGVIPDAATDGELASEFDVLPAEVAAVLDRADPTRALDLIWQRVRRLNRYVEERAPWELARDEASAAELDQTLASLGEGLRAVSVLLHPYMPDTVDRLLEALGAPGVRFERALFAERGSGATVAALEPLFPKRDK